MTSKQPHKIVQRLTGHPVKEKLEITVADNLMIHEIFASYDFIQLIGENGGVVGVIFGWSVLFIIEAIKGWIVKNNSWKFMIKRGTTFIMFILFLIWSSEVLRTYDNEIESMEIQVKKSLQHFPHITICKEGCQNDLLWGFLCTDYNQAFVIELEENFPCSIPFTNYRNAVKKCLEQGYDGLIQYLMQYKTSNLPRILISTQNKSIILLDDTAAWTKVFHPAYGACYTYHSRYFFFEQIKVQDFNVRISWKHHCK